MKIVNIGCIGPEGLVVELDNVLCLVGANNSGKSTVLRAYELAVGSESFIKERDLCQRANGEAASVELWVHIPEGTANVSSDWKTPEGDLLLVRSRWEWSEEGKWSRVRRTWDPHVGDFSLDAKASGLDTVFDSRLPKPFRIGTLEDPQREHERLLTLILQPVADKLKAAMSETGSKLSQAIETVTTLAQEPVTEEQQKLGTVKDDLNRSHGEIFPDLRIDFDIGVGRIDFDPIKQLLSNSRLKFTEWATEVRWNQQGTGSQRALFWTMLQVRSKLNALSDIISKGNKRVSDCEKEIKKLTKSIETLKKDDAKQRKQEEINRLSAEVEQIRGKDPACALAEQAGEFALPGYMLLIDEPEVALHPGAVRAASKYLYNLADDPGWQVMISTHAPAFINPLQDHTTVVRLDRCQSCPTPSTYRSDTAGFTEDQKTQLKMLNKFDTGLSEMFFGQYPIVVEGDTEFAAFETAMNLVPDEFPLQRRPVLVRARGKASMILIVKMLGHFKVPFSILHDSDSPLRADGKKNSAWSANSDLYSEIREARKAGVRVVHRVSVPGFEFVHLPLSRHENGTLREPAKEEKPWNMAQAVRLDVQVRDSVLGVLRNLMTPAADEEPFGPSFGDGLQKAVSTWASANAPADGRFRFD